MFNVFFWLMFITCGLRVFYLAYTNFMDEFEDDSEGEFDKFMTWFTAVFCATCAAALWPIFVIMWGIYALFFRKQTDSAK